MSIKYTDISNLSNQELLSLTLRESAESKVIEELINRFDSPRDLAGATFAELTEIKGLGPVKAYTILASLELAKRLYSATSEDKASIRSPQDAASLVMTEMRYLDRECFRVILLSTKNHVLKTETVSIGTLNSSVVHPREVFKFAIRNSAAAVILVHNHPSGDPAPSREDIEITGRLVEAGKLMGIEVLDHIIIGDGRFVSFKEKGLI